MKLLLSFTLFLSIVTCHRHAVEGPPPVTFQDQPAVVKVVVATRGSYQYLLEISDPPAGIPVRCMPLALDDTFKTDGLSVLFDGELTGDSLWVYEPAPNDVPQPAYQLPGVRITRMEKQ